MIAGITAGLAGAVGAGFAGSGKMAGITAGLIAGGGVAALGVSMMIAGTIGAPAIGVPDKIGFQAFAAPGQHCLGGRTCRT